MLALCCLAHCISFCRWVNNHSYLWLGSFFCWRDATGFVWGSCSVFLCQSEWPSMSWWTNDVISGAGFTGTVPLLSAMNADEIAFPRFVSFLRTIWSCNIWVQCEFFSTSLSDFAYYLSTPHSFSVFSRKFDLNIAVCTGSTKLVFFSRHTARTEIHSHPHASPEIPLLIHISSPKTHIFHLSYCKKNQTQTKQKPTQTPANHSNTFQLKTDAK